MSDDDITVDRAELEAAWNHDVTERSEAVAQMRRDAQAVFRAMEGWNTVRTPEDWQAIVEGAGFEHRSGKFLLNQLGAERYLDPQLMATLWTLRRDLIAEADASSTAEAMLADLTVLGYYHTMRIQGWIGSLALLIEHELFGQDSPSVNYRKERGKRAELVVENELKRLREELLPLLDRANRMTLRNLKAMQDMRRQPTSNVSIERAEQVNVGTQQVNTVVREESDRDGDEPRSC